MEIDELCARTSMSASGVNIAKTILHLVVIRCPPYTHTTHTETETETETERDTQTHTSPYYASDERLHQHTAHSSVGKAFGGQLSTKMRRDKRCCVSSHKIAKRAEEGQSDIHSPKHLQRSHYHYHYWYKLLNTNDINTTSTITPRASNRLNYNTINVKCEALC